MTDQPAGTRPNRVRPRLVVALAVAAVVAAGIVGVLLAALTGGGSDTTGAGLGPTVDVEHPAAITTAPAIAGDVGAAGTAGPDTGVGGEIATTTSTLVTIGGIDATEVPVTADLPMPSDPVVLPTFVTVPAPPSTLAAVPFDEFDPAAVPGLDGWTVSAHTDDRLTLVDGTRVVEVLRLPSATSAGDAIDQLFDRLTGDFQDLSSTPPQRLSAPTTRFTYVSGSQFTATRVSQQRTIPVTGSVIAGVGPDGNAVVVAALRDGTASADDLAADGAVANAVLAALAP